MSPVEGNVPKECKTERTVDKSSGKSMTKVGTRPHRYLYSTTQSRDIRLAILPTVCLQPILVREDQADLKNYNQEVMTDILCDLW